MTRDEEIALCLRDASVPGFALQTTLLKEGAPSLREMVQTRALLKHRQTVGVFMHPATPVDAARSRKLFYLLAKELFLAGTTVFCLPLASLYPTLMGVDTTDEAGRAADMLDRVRMVFLLDFYEHGAASPLQPHEAARVRAWVRSRFEQGHGVCFLSDSPLDMCVAWWPQSLLGFIRDHTIVERV